jgi:hypothetical protein
MKINLLLATIVILTGCAGDPAVLMKIGKEKNLHGETNGRLLESGNFQAENAEHLRCSGEYEESNRSLMPVNINCSDDRFGKVVIVRSSDGKSGRGNGRLSDGSKFTVIIGKGAEAAE